MSKTLEPEELMDRDHLARLLRRGPGMVTRYATLGSMPVAEGGGHGKQARYLPSACVAWLLAQAEAKAAPAGALNPVLERARRDHHQAELAKQLHQKRAGEMLDREDVRRTWSSLVIACRARLLRLPSALAEQCAREADPAKVQAVLDRYVRDALTELSRGGAITDPTPPPGAEPKRKKGRKS
jgi:phage terminase Nu1 subunit (DNA packaging protein)